MNISAVRNGLAGAVVALTAISCECKNEENIARSRVVPYLNGTELYTADSVAQSDRLQSLVAGSQKQKMLYWDSIVADGKAKEAFMRGMQMVNDSADGKPYKKEKFVLPLADKPSTDCEEILESLKKEASKMNDAKTEKKKQYYKEGMRMLFLTDENFDNFKQVYEDYKNALEMRSDRVKKLYDEIKIIKKLEI